MKRDDIAFGSSGFECKRQIILRINLAKTDNSGVLVCLHYPFLIGASLVIWKASVRCPLDHRWRASPEFSNNDCLMACQTRAGC